MTYHIAGITLPPPVIDFIESSAKARGYTLEEVLTKRRYPVLVHIRYQAFVMLRNEPYEWSYLRIAEAFDIDHSTVIYGVRIAS